jgi:dihydroorotase
LAKLTVNPARLLELEAGRLSLGAPADLVLFDPERPWKITEAGLTSLAKNTAFEGRLVQGRVLMTLVDGRVVHRFAG